MYASVSYELAIPSTGICPAQFNIPAVISKQSQAEVRSGNSMFGRAGDERSLTNIRLPYVMRIAWEPERTVSTMRCHKMVAEPLTRIFQAALDHYGMEKIREMGLDLYGGCFNDRAIIGGKATSMHAWGIAVDMDPDRNGLNVHSPHAVFSRPDYAAFWEIVEAEGAVSLGRARDYDWMHFQFATL